MTTTAKKMGTIAEAMEKSIPVTLPYKSVKVEDGICSSVTVYGSLQKKEDWANGIFHNSPYFIIHIFPKGGKRFYEDGDEVTVELTSKSFKLPKMRKYTGTTEKAVKKVKEYLEKLLENQENSENSP